MDQLPEYALYYPGSLAPISWMKNMLLFTDGIALLTSDNIRNPQDHFARAMYGNNPIEWRDLVDNDAVLIHSANIYIDDKMARQISERLTETFIHGLISPRLFSRSTNQFGINPLKLGITNPRQLSSVVYNQLIQLGHLSIQRDSYVEEQWSHGYQDHNRLFASRELLTITSSIYAQIVSQNAALRQEKFRPSTDDSYAHEMFERIAKTKSRMKLISADMKAISINVKDIPVGEIISFRKEFGNELRLYLREIEMTAISINNMQPTDQDIALAIRREELEEAYQVYLNEKLLSREWGTRVLNRGMARLAVAASAWMVADYFGLHPLAEIAMTGLVSSAIPESSVTPTQESANSFMFRAANTF